MPLPSFLICANILVCERVLQEKDDVLSMVRMVDIYSVPQPPDLPLPDFKQGDPVPPGIPVIYPWAVATMKAEPGYFGLHKMEIKVQNTVGEILPLGPVHEGQFSGPQPNAPTALGIVAQFSLAVRRLGNCYICLFLDGHEVARTPLTLVAATASK